MKDSTTHYAMLRPEQLADRWGTSAGRLANMRCTGTGPTYVRIGSSIRYRVADIEDYERLNTVAPAA